MAPSKGHYTVGQAYIAFSSVTKLDKLHMINYTRELICVTACRIGDGEVVPKHPTTYATMSF